MSRCSSDCSFWHETAIAAIANNPAVKVKCFIRVKIIIKNNVYNLVIGFPIQLDGQIGERGKSVKRFIDDFLKENSDFNLNINYQDERYSTLEAHERLKNSGLKENKINKIIDMYSAVVILEDFLKKQNI